jgi:hypothetical protein
MEFNLADLFEGVADAVPVREALVCGHRRLTHVGYLLVLGLPLRMPSNEAGLPGGLQWSQAGREWHGRGSASCAGGRTGRSLLSARGLPHLQPALRLRRPPATVAKLLRVQP